MDQTAAALLILVIAQSAMLGVLLRLYLQAKQLHEKATREAGRPAALTAQPSDQDVGKRWESLDLSRLHEVNREEVEKLLAKMRGMGVKSLTAGERAFLERMSQAVRLS